MGLPCPIPVDFIRKKPPLLSQPLRILSNGAATAQVVFMLAVKSGDQQFLRNFYELIVNLSESAEHVNRVLRVQSFDELVGMFRYVLLIYGIILCRPGIILPIFILGRQKGENQYDKAD